MSTSLKTPLLFAVVAAMIIATGQMQSWNTALQILNFGLISAIMALGVNLQWGFAGLFNVGIMGFVALGGLATVIVSMPPTTEAWSAGGLRILLGLAMGAATIVAGILLWARLPRGRMRGLVVAAVLVLGFALFRMVFDGGISAGGMPTRVKCLHVLVGHALAKGPGVNPLGDEAVELLGDYWGSSSCAPAGTRPQDAQPDPAA